MRMPNFAKRDNERRALRLRLSPVWSDWSDGKADADDGLTVHWLTLTFSDTELEQRFVLRAFNRYRLHSFAMSCSIVAMFLVRPVLFRAVSSSEMDGNADAFMKAITWSVPLSANVAAISIIYVFDRRARFASELAGQHAAAKMCAWLNVLSYITNLVLLVVAARMGVDAAGECAADNKPDTAQSTLALHPSTILLTALSNVIIIIGCHLLAYPPLARTILDLFYGACLLLSQSARMPRVPGMRGHLTCAAACCPVLYCPVLCAVGFSCIVPPLSASMSHAAQIPLLLAALPVGHGAGYLLQRRARQLFLLELCAANDARVAYASGAGAHGGEVAGGPGESIFGAPHSTALDAPAPADGSVARGAHAASSGSSPGSGAHSGGGGGGGSGHSLVDARPRASPAASGGLSGKEPLTSAPTNWEAASSELATRAVHFAANAKRLIAHHTRGAPAAPTCMLCASAPSTHTALPCACTCVCANCARALLQLESPMTTREVIDARCPTCETKVACLIYIHDESKTLHICRKLPMGARIIIE